MGGSARPLGGTLSSSSSTAICPQRDRNWWHPGAHMVQSAVARDLLCNAARGWGPRGPSPPQGMPTPALTALPAGFLAAGKAAAASTESVEPSGLCGFREKEGSARRSPLLSVQGEEPRQGPGLDLYPGHPPSGSELT